MIHMAIGSFTLATLVCLAVGGGHLLGFCEPNVCYGESYVRYYLTLWASVAVPAPVVVGILALLQRLFFRRRKAV